MCWLWIETPWFDKSKLARCSVVYSTPQGQRRCRIWNWCNERMNKSVSLLQMRLISEYCRYIAIGYLFRRTLGYHHGWLPPMANGYHTGPHSLCVAALSCNVVISRIFCGELELTLNCWPKCIGLAIFNVHRWLIRFVFVKISPNDFCWYFIHFV